MTDYSEKHLCIDAGIGEKMDGCPYSFYEDGHDVEDYIIPPKGYAFIGFQYIPTPDNQIYDGKLIAQYERIPLKDRMKDALRASIWILVSLAVIGLIVLLAVSVFKPQKSSNQTPSKPQMEQPSLSYLDTLTENDTLLKVKDSVAVEQHIEIQEENSIQSIVPEQSIQNDSLIFKQAFWTLIHERTIQMDPYDSLYKENKGKVSGEEFDYLRFTILKDSPSFKEWYTKLRQIPIEELIALESISELKSKLNEIK